MGKIIWILKAGFLLGLTAAIFLPALYFGYELFIRPHQVPSEATSALYKAPPDPSLPEFEKALEVLKKGKWLEARSVFDRFIETYPFSTKMQEARDALGKANAEIFFSSIPSPDKVRYEVQRGDAIAKIERKFKVDRELLMRSNNLDDPRRLSVGQVLYINQPSFSLVIDRAKKKVTVNNFNRYFKDYKTVEWNAPAATPGSGPIQSKVREKVAWWDGGRVHFGAPEYSDSTKWVEITTKGFTLYGIGGKKPDSGGIALPPEEMEELSILLRRDTPVLIQ